MTFNPSIPLAGDSPSKFPAQSQTNYARLQTLVGADHQFNLSAAANDGYHNLIHMTQQAPAGVLAATGRLYAKSSAGRIQAFYMDDQASAYQLTPTMPIRAAVNFLGNLPVGAQTIRSQYNVTSVTKTASGKYTVTFTTAMPDANYIVSLSGMFAVDTMCIGSVLGDATYGNSVTTTTLKISFVSLLLGFQDVIMGNLVIHSVT